MKMDEHARAWAHEFVSGILNTSAVSPPQRNSLHWEILSHLHEAAERHAESRGAGQIGLADIQAVVAQLGGREGIAATFLEIRVAGTPRAGFGKRFAAYLVDAVIVFFGVWFVVGGLMGFFAAFFAFIAKGEFFFAPLYSTAGPIFGIGLSYAYFVFTEYKYGATVGKMAFKLRTVQLDGQPLTIGAALIRNFAKVVPPLLLLDTLLYVLAFQKDDQRASDRLVNTIVIDTTRTAWVPASTPPEPTPPAIRTNEPSTKFEPY